MAEVFCVQVSPHKSNSMALGAAAAVHASLGISNLSPVEYFPLFETVLDHVCKGRSEVRYVYIAYPKSNGLGITFDDAQMEKYRV